MPPPPDAEERMWAALGRLYAWTRKGPYHEGHGGPKIDLSYEGGYVEEAHRKGFAMGIVLFANAMDHSPEWGMSWVRALSWPPCANGGCTVDQFIAELPAMPEGDEAADA